MGARHSDGTVTLRSSDDSVQYALVRDPDRLWVERAQMRHGMARVVHTASFANIEGFLRWCDADAMRFEHPLVHSKVRQCGADLLDAAWR